MFAFFHAIVERFRAKHVADAGLDFESQLIARDAERKAVLLRRAARYEDEGLHGIADELHQRAGAISFTRPLSSLLPAKAETTDAQPVHAIGTNGDSVRSLAKKGK